MIFQVETLPKPESLFPSKYLSIDNGMLSPDQLEVYNQVLNWYRDPNKRQYLKLGGYAGTGKTTLTGVIALELEKLGEKVIYTAFTGKAVNVLNKKLRQAGAQGECVTLHSLMYKPNIDAQGKIVGWKKRDKTDFPGTFVVVDEASMVGEELWIDLVSYGFPILAVGDHGQLPPIGDNVVNLMERPDIRLEKIHRQAEGNPILSLAQWVREGKPFREFVPSDNRVSFVKSVAALATQLSTADPINFGAICYTNKTRASLNKAIRAWRGINSVYPVVNDTVICLRNARPVFNGMRGTISGMSTGYDDKDNFNAAVDFPDDGFRARGMLHMPQFGQPATFSNLADMRLKYSDPRLEWKHLGLLFDYGYAMTCHKSQGSQFSNVVLVYENLFRDSDTRNRWLYTAVTRASEQLFIVRA